MIDPHSYNVSAAGQSEARTAGYMPVYGEKKGAEAQHFSDLVQQAQGDSSPTDTAKAAGHSGHHGFLDFLVTLFDIINPLEHLPIISTIYEHVTGHHMNPVARIAGDTLYGGPIGAAVGVANVIAEKKTGKDLGENVMAMFSHHKHDAPQDTMVAQNDVKAPDIIWSDASAPAAPVSGTVMAGEPSEDLNARLSLVVHPKLKQDFPSLAAQQSHGASNAGKKLAEYSMSRVPPVPTAKDGISEGGARVSASAPARTDSTPGPSAQDAPAGSPEQAIPPGLIAQKMMEGLDKYAALEKVRMAPGYSAAY